MKSNLMLFIDGIFKENPAFFLILGMCPTLAVTTSLENGIGMGIATSAVLLFSCILISMIKDFIPHDIRIPSFIVIIASFVTITSLIMEAFAPNLFTRLGIYVPLIVVNCIVLGRVLAFAYKNPVLPTFFDSLGMGFGFTGALIIIATIRELLGTGKIVFMGTTLLSLPISKMIIMVLPPGALLTMGLLLGLFNMKRLKNG